MCQMTSIIGRVYNIRLAGKALFMDLQSGEQLYFNINDTRDFAIAKNDVSRGDILETTAYEHFVTRTGHPSIKVLKFSIFKKCEANIPLVTSKDGEDFNALGTELTRRRRVLTWVAEPRRLEWITQRSVMVDEIRSNLRAAGSVEITTPTLQPVYGGAAADPFVTTHNALGKDFFLRISPELYLKRLIMAGVPFVHEFATCFRNEGIDRTHNPEFTLLEVYKAGETYEWGMEFTEQVVRSALRLDESAEFVHINVWDELMSLGMDALQMNGKEAMLAFEEEAEPNLVERHGRFVFVTEHPVEVSPLAYSSDGISADRFELYVDGMEVANGYSEQNDWRVQQAAMQAIGNVDEDYIEDMKIGLPRTCGIGIGIDRLAMIRCGSTDIKDVVAFPAY